MAFGPTYEQIGEDLGIELGFCDVRLNRLVEEL